MPKRIRKDPLPVDMAQFWRSARSLVDNEEGEMSSLFDSSGSPPGPADEAVARSRGKRSERIRADEEEHSQWNTAAAKARPCKWFTRSACKFGDNCRYRHEPVFDSVSRAVGRIGQGGVSKIAS